VCGNSEFLFSDEAAGLFAVFSASSRRLAENRRQKAEKTVILSSAFKVPNRRSCKRFNINIIIPQGHCHSPRKHRNRTPSRRITRADKRRGLAAASSAGAQVKESCGPAAFYLLVRGAEAVEGGAATATLLAVSGPPALLFLPSSRPLQGIDLRSVAVSAGS
jgi:hypothetical protein